jgi:pilus assembly protein Flp/PilA
VAFIVVKERGGIMLFSIQEKGQGLLEYAMILILVAAIVLLVLALLGPTVGRLFSNVVQKV